MKRTFVQTSSLGGWYTVTSNNNSWLCAVCLDLWDGTTMQRCRACGGEIHAHCQIAKYASVCVDCARNGEL